MASQQQAAPGTPGNPTLLQQRAMQYATPATIPAIQHSQYLAQALESLQQSATQNMRTPTALWSNLLADALLQFGRRQSDQALQTGSARDQASMMNAGALPGETLAPVPAGGQSPGGGGLLAGLSHLFFGNGQSTPTNATGTPASPSDGAGPHYGVAYPTDGPAPSAMIGAGSNDSSTTTDAASPQTAAPAGGGGLIGGIGNALGGIEHAVVGAPAMLAHFLGGGSAATAPGASQPPANGGMGGLAIGSGPTPPQATPAPPINPIQSAPLPPAQPAPTSPPQGAPPPQSVAPVAPAAGAQINPQLDALVRTVYGEARGEPTLGQQGVAAVVLNRAKATGLSPSAIVAAPKQFPGYWSPAAQNLSPSDPAYQSILNSIQPTLQGFDPTGGADHFYAPRGMPGGRAPSWAEGKPGLVIGNHIFMGLGPNSAGSPQGAQPQAVAQAPAPTQIAANASQGMAGAQGSAPAPQGGVTAPAPPSCVREDA